jgi:4a-hydroxytetrahydrobiopterin dehydratase
MSLSEEKCMPCHAGDKPLPAQEAQDLLRNIPQWVLSEKTVQREFAFKDFRASMAFVNRVAELANEQDHHPDLHIFYNRVKLVLSTHKVGGLSRNDFILAAKIDRVAE